MEAIKIFLPLFLLLSFFCAKGEINPLTSSNGSCHHSLTWESSKILDVWWINLEKAHSRRAGMIKMLREFGLFEKSKHFSALTPANIVIPQELEKAEWCRYLSQAAIQEKITLLSKNHRGHHNYTALLTAHCSTYPKREKETPYVLATALSHSIAIFRAVHHNPSKKYALILEDDVALPMDVDFVQLMKSAPPKFSVLQLNTNNLAKAQELWDEYLETKQIWHQRKGGNYWSAGAYIINKEVLRPVINSIIQQIAPSIFTVFLHASNMSCSSLDQICCQSGSKYPSPPCIRSYFGYAADYFIYNLDYFNSYITTIPIFLNNLHAQNSTIHQIDVRSQQKAIDFARNTVYHVLTANITLLPSFLRATCITKDLLSEQNDKL